MVKVNDVDPDLHRPVSSIIIWWGEEWCHVDLVWVIYIAITAPPPSPSQLTLLDRLTSQKCGSDLRRLLSLVWRCVFACWCEKCHTNKKTRQDGFSCSPENGDGTPSTPNLPETRGVALALPAIRLYEINSFMPIGVWRLSLLLLFWRIEIAIVWNGAPSCDSAWHS